MQPFTLSRHMTAIIAALFLLPIGAVMSGSGSVATSPAFLDVIKDGAIDGLNLADAAVVSPDGAHVYVVSEGDRAVAVFGRNTASGSLSFIEMLQDGVNGVDGLSVVVAVAISPDGQHLYTASRGDDAVAVFGREAVSGTLTHVEMKKDGVGGVDGLDGAHAIAVSPDGQHVYASSENDDAVAVFSRSAITGGLTFVEVHKDGVAGVDGINTSRGLAISPDGKHVYATGVDDDAVAVFSRSTSSGALTFVEMEKDGVNGVDGLASAISVRVSPDGKHVYAAGYNDDAIAAFDRNATTGALTYTGLAQNGVNDVDKLDGPNWLAASPAGDHLYAPGRVAYAVVTLSRNSATGALAFVEADVDGAGVDGLNGAASLAFSSDGQHLYVAGYADSGIGVLSRHPSTGKLAFVEAKLDVFPVDGLYAASSVIVSPDGKHVYATGQQDSGLAAFSRDPITGSLTFVEALLDGTGGVDGLSNPEMAVISPDGLNIYVAATGDNAVGVFSRNALSGTLTFVERKQDGVGGVDGLRSTQGIAISPDGQHVYATSADDDAVAVFSRGAITGSLTFVEMKQDGVGDIDGLDFARGVAVSPDGQHVYVTGEVDDALAVFGRNAASGALTFVEVLKNGVGGVEGLDGAYAVSVGPSVRHVYVVSEAGDTLATFERDIASGLLTFQSVQRDGVNGVDGLNAARAVVASPDGKHIYVAGFLDDSVAIFQGEQRVFLPLALR